MYGFEQTLARSHDFTGHLVNILNGAEGWLCGDRFEAAGAAAELSLEHGQALRVLFEAGTPNSAAAMLRLQYESLLRASWLLYAAAESQVDKLSAPLTEASAAAAKNAISAEKMLSALESAAEKNPNLSGLVAPLREVRDVSWQPMNGFVHAGLHALARKQEGFPVDLATSILKNSNGLVHMAARLLARMTTSMTLAAKVHAAHSEFKDVLPMASAQT